MSTFCPYCGSGDHGDAPFCPKTGKKIADAEQKLEMSKTVFDPQPFGADQMMPLAPAQPQAPQNPDPFAGTAMQAPPPGAPGYPGATPPGAGPPGAMPPGAAPPGAAPGYPPQGGAPGYPPQGGAPGYPPQGGAPGYPPQAAAPGYPPQAAAPGYPPGAAPPGAQPPAGGGHAPPQGGAPGYPPQGGAPPAGYPPAGGAAYAATSGGADPFAGTAEVGDLIKNAFAFWKTKIVALTIVAGVAFVPIYFVHGCVGSVALGAFAVGGAAVSSPAVAMQKRMAKLKELRKSGEMDMLTYQEEMRKVATMATLTATAGATAVTGGILATIVGILVTFVLALLIMAVAIPLAYAAVTYTVAGEALGQPMSPGAAWGKSLGRLVPLLLTGLIAGLGVFLGMLLLVIPGLILAFLFCLMPIVVVLEKRSMVDALKRSAALVKTDWVKSLIVMLVIGFTQWLAGLLAGLLSFLPFLGWVLHGVFAAALMPLGIVAAVLLYFDVRRRLDGVDAATIRADVAGAIS